MADLKKRRLGKTGLMVTELGLGAMDTPTSLEGEATLRAALDADINFIDTARDYQGSEYLIGQAIRARGRKDCYLASKTFSRNRDGAQYDVDRSLQVLGVSKIDLYQLHDVSTPEQFEQVMHEEDGALAGLKIAQARGLIDHIGVSSHGLDVAEKLITSGEFETIMLEYSAFYTDSRRLLALAKQHDVGVIGMRPLGGSGRTSMMRTRMKDIDLPPALTPSTLLRYVLSNPDISVAIPGARYPSRIHDNAVTASSYQRLSDSEMRQCEEAAAHFFE